MTLAICSDEELAVVRKPALCSPPCGSTLDVVLTAIEAGEQQLTQKLATGTQAIAF